MKADNYWIMKKGYSLFLKSGLLWLTMLLAGSFTAFSQSAQKLYEKYAKYSGAKNWKQADQVLDTLLLLEPKNNYWLVSKAETASQLGNLASAIQFLEKSIDNGYLYLEEIITDDNFQSIRGTDAYIKLVEKLQQRLSKFRLSASDQRMTIDVLPLMECYVIMLYLGNPKHTLVNDNQSHAYFKKIDAYFGKFRNHRLVKQLASRYPSDNNEWINNLRAHHNLRTFYVYDSLDIDNIRRFPIEIDTDLAKLVRDFARATDFMKFYTDNLEFYEAMKKIMYTNYAFGSNVISFFNDNFDMRINRFNVYFSPIYGGWQHGPVAKMENYTECFYFGGIMYTNTREFYYPDVNLLFTFLTEFDHTPINALTAKYKKEIEQYKDKVPVLNTTGSVSYGNIISTMEEYITWAFALQYFYEKAPSEYPSLENSIVNSMEKGRKFSKFGEFVNFYKTYINDRKKYPALKDFYPDIIKWVSSL